MLSFESHFYEKRGANSIENGLLGACGYDCFFWVDKKEEGCAWGRGYTSWENDYAKGTCR